MVSTRSGKRGLAKPVVPGRTRRADGHFFQQFVTRQIEPHQNGVKRGQRINWHTQCGITISRTAILVLDISRQVFSSAYTTTLVWGATKAVLQTAHSLVGPWRDMPGATSPFDIGLFPTNEFFRLDLPGP